MPRPLVAGFEVSTEGSSAHDAWGSQTLLHRAMVCDLFQDVMRIRLRIDPHLPALIVVPTTAPSIIV